MIRRQFLVLASPALLVAACGTSDTGGTRGGSGSVQPGSPEHFMQSAGDRIFFEVDRWELSSTARETLDRQVAWLKQYGDRYPSVTIEGHADERGTREYNIALSERRAATARDYLSANGVSPARLKTVGYGKERPEVVGDDEGAWSRNRRDITTLR
jgi:peptidoglycan-associated lipoprotein